MDDPESNMVCSKNYEPYEVTPLLKNSDKHLSFLHLNISFTSCSYWRAFNTWITERNLTFDFIRITESRLTLHKNLISSIQLPGYNIEYTPTECSNEGTLLYTKNGIKYKLRKDLQIYKSKQLESTFIEVSQDKTKVLIGWVYRHLSIEFSKFNNHYLSNLSETLSNESKTQSHLGDLNADLLKYDRDSNISDFWI